jgi:methionyl-tRNA formyltransferase
MQPRPRAPRISLHGVFFGTSDFAVPALRAFATATTCTLVVTQPDRPAGRGNKLQPTPVKRTAQELGIATIEPARMRDAFETLRDCAADVFGVASYGKIVPQSILDLAPHGALNVHPSLLPLYRGATPLQTQLRDGVTDGGVTIILMDAGMDTGDIVLQERSAIGPHETYGELHDRLALVGASLLTKACEAVESGTLTRTPQAGLAAQEDVTATTTRPLRKDDWKIGSHAERCTALDYVNFVRSLAPAPAARISFATYESVKVFGAHVLDEPGPPLDTRPGVVVVAEGTILVRASDGWIAIDELAPPGGKRVPAAAFRNGNKINYPPKDQDALRAWSQTRMKAVH